MCSKIFRVFVMFVLTITTATIEIISGIHSSSNSLIADGLYSFAEGLCLIGVMIVLHYSKKERFDQKSNTFGHERLELLFGLIQEIFLLSVSLGIIVDAINHLIHPKHIEHPQLMIVLGGMGMIVGIVGMSFFWGYHHDHDIEREISQKKKKDFLYLTNQFTKTKKRSNQIPLTNESPIHPLNRTISNESKTTNQLSYLQDFTYENVQISESRIYATLHALCLHSFVVLLESVIVVLSGLLIEYIPHIDPVTEEEINLWLKYIDPSLTLIMVIIIAIRTIPVIFSISRILIENVPHGIDTQQLMNEIIRTIPQIQSIHSLHIWRATAKEIYATFHLVCAEDILLSKSTNQFGKKIRIILNSYCIKYFTLQFEYLPFDQSNQYRCVYGIHRQRRGHTLILN